MADRTAPVGSPACPSATAKCQVGKRVRYSVSGKKTVEPVEVIIEAVRRSSKVIWNSETNEETPGIEFKMRPVAGGKPFWSVTFPDREAKADA